MEFDWDEDNLRHIAEHNVEPEEVEFVLRNPALDLDYEIMHGEERFSEVGITRQGRLLLVVMTLPETKHARSPHTMPQNPR